MMLPPACASAGRGMRTTDPISAAYEMSRASTFIQLLRIECTGPKSLWFTELDPAKYTIARACPPHPLIRLKRFFWAHGFFGSSVFTTNYLFLRLRLSPCNQFALHDLS